MPGGVKNRVGVRLHRGDRIVSTQIGGVPECELPWAAERRQAQAQSRQAQLSGS